MTWIKILLLSLLVGCATIKSPTLPKPKVMDKKLAFFIKKFEHLYGKKITTDISIGLILDDRGVPRIHTTGVCYRHKNKVILNKLRWKKQSTLHQEALVFHELGHCELKRGHPDHQRKYTIPEFLNNGLNCPKSIMNSGTTSRKMTDYCYAYYYDYYMSELFANKRIREWLR